MQNVAYALNILRPHVSYLNYSVNWLPATAQLPSHAQMGNMGQVANQLERLQTERATPTPQVERWPVTHNTGE